MAAIQQFQEETLPAEGECGVDPAQPVAEDEMACPACGHVMAQDSEECPDCGIRLA